VGGGFCFLPGYYSGMSSGKGSAMSYLVSDDREAKTNAIAVVFRAWLRPCDTHTLLGFINTPKSTIANKLLTGY
jgi:hypothetical protein